MSAPRTQVGLSAKARADVRNILAHTRKIWGEAQGTAYRDKIEKTLRVLINHPEIGERRDDLITGCRVLRIGSHIAIYQQITVNEIVVLRILHERQDAHAELERPSLD
jgi:toxin ParE1/3/4